MADLKLFSIKGNVEELPSKQSDLGKGIAKTLKEDEFCVDMVTGAYLDEDK